MRILCIGNSHTFCNGLPFQLRELLRNDYPATEIAMHAPPGVTLGWHALQPETQMAILYHDWDYIVLQQRSHPFDGYAALQSDCDALLPFLRRSAAKTLMFVTWSEKRLPENQAIIDDAFTQVAHEISASLVPVSRAWQTCLHDEADIELYDTDGEHASPRGSYLAACVFYSVIQGRSPVGLPNAIRVNGDELVNLAHDMAERIQRVVARTILPTQV